ncbi:hypothetical protein L9F63_020665, partial [Diploptera punctata]
VGSDIPDTNINLDAAEYGNESELEEPVINEENINNENTSDKRPDRKFEINTLTLKIGQKNSAGQIMSQSYEAQAKKHEYYADQFMKRAKSLEIIAKEHKIKSAKHQEAALTHEKKASEYSRKSRESRKKAENLEAMASHFLTRYKSEMRSYAIAEAESKDAWVMANGYETEFKNHYAWANELRATAKKAKRCCENSQIFSNRRTKYCKRTETNS